MTTTLNTHINNTLVSMLMEMGFNPADGCDIDMFQNMVSVLENDCRKIVICEQEMLVQQQAHISALNKYDMMRKEIGEICDVPYIAVVL